MDRLQLAFDLGAASVGWALLDGGALAARPRRHSHGGHPLEGLLSCWDEARREMSPGRAVAMAFTGIGARDLSLWRRDLPFFHETVAIPWGARFIAPSLSLVFHVGARQSLFFRLRQEKDNPIVLDWSAGTRCGGGSGILVEKQLLRLFAEGALPRGRAEQEALRDQVFAEARAAAEALEAPPYNARCGVIVQSDLIHDQNAGKDRPELTARLFATVARNYLADVVASRPLDGPVLATGGLLESPLLRRYLRKDLDYDLIHHDLSPHVAAIGAAFAAGRRGNDFILDFTSLDEARRHSRSRRVFAPPLAEALEKVRIFADDHRATDGTGPVTIGVDGGSTTTKAVAADVKTGEFVAGFYLPTAGRPREALARVMELLRGAVGHRSVAALVTTGSARVLFERILLRPSLLAEARRQGCLLDGAVDEITCHGLGVRFCDDQVDTIFEVGGQDMKFTAFRRQGPVVTDEVVEARMNYSCQAGAGQTLENMARLLDLDVVALQEAALGAERVPLIDATCGVFMEMEEGRLLAEGFGRDEVAAAIVRATAASYFHRFVGGGAHLQERCSCQGGPSLGRAFLAAMAQVTGREIHAYPHRELFGAWGAALCGRERVLRARDEGCRTESAFRGWEATDAEFHVTETRCSVRFGPLSCGRRDCTLQVYSIDGEEVLCGGFCPRGNSEAPSRPRRDWVRLFHDLLESHWPSGGPGPTVAIRRAGVTLGPLGLWTAHLLSGLGLTPLLGPPSTSQTVSRGTLLAPTDFCLAMKLLLGQAEELSRSGAEFLFNGSFVEKARKGQESLKFCVYTASEGYLVQALLGLDRRRSLAPVWRLGDRPQMTAALALELDRLGLHRSRSALNRAQKGADEAMAPFWADLEREGERFLAELDGPGYVGLGRDYVLLDDEASSAMGSLFSQVRGLSYLPQIFLRHRWETVPMERLVPDEFWVQGSSILQAEALTALDGRLYPVRQMNFACGPDSVRTLLEEEIFRRAGKPFLQLVTDGQTNNAPFATRIEAQERVVGRHRPAGPLEVEALFPRRPDASPGRTWIVPPMGSLSFLGAALLRHYGQPALCPPTATAESLAWSDRVLSAENCLPLKGVVGDVLAYLDDLRKRGGRPERDHLVFLPTTCGPCRMGRYGEVLSLALERWGFPGLPVAGPSTATGYSDFPLLEDRPLGERVRLLLDAAELFLLADAADGLLLRYRPYGPDREAFQDLARERWLLLETIVERDGLARTGDWLVETARLYRREIGGAGEPRRPVVLYVGEIYMRLHDGRTQNVVDLLEEAGLELFRLPAAEWIRYVLDEPRRKGGLAPRLIKGWLAWCHRRWSRLCPEGFHLPDPFSLVVDLERRNLHHRLILGESGPSLGLFLAFAEGRLPEEICGFFHVAPFTCMQEGVAGAQMDAYRQRRRDGDVVPLLHGFFGDSPHPGLEAAVAAFAEQCRVRRLQTR